MTERKEDLRIVKTRAALSTAFFKMLEDTEVSDITVNKLCEVSGVRRATFYKHFRDKDDFIMFIIKDVRSYFDNEVWKRDLTPITKDYYYQYAETLLDFLLEHEVAMKKVATSHMHSAFIDILLQQNYADTKRRLEASVSSGMKLIASPDVVASMLIGGVAHCVIRWFENDDRCSPQVLLSDIKHFIERVIS
jgi:AcrR family transcriptional regulator